MSTSLYFLVLIFLVLCSSPTPSSSQHSSLHGLVASGDSSGLKKVLVEGVSPEVLNERRNDNGQTPLMAACLAGDARAVSLLLNFGADATIGEKDGYTCAHGAGFQGRKSVMKVLAKRDFDLESFHKDGYAPIHRACWGREQRHTDTVRYLVEELGLHELLKSKGGKTCADMTSNPATVAFLDTHQEAHHTKEPIAQAEDLRPNELMLQDEL